jgi:translocation and assembly module TamB
VRLDSIDGRLRDYPVRASGAATFAAGTLRVDRLDVASGDNRMLANGSVGATTALELSVDAPRLAQLWPDLSGSLSGRGRLELTGAEPLIDADLSGRDIRYGELSATRLDARADIRPAGDAGTGSSLSIEMTGGRIAGQTVERLTVDGDGSPSSHRVVAALETAAGSAGLELKGAFDGSAWRGTIEGLDIDETRSGRWSLVAPVAIEAGADSAAAGELCLGRGDGRLCAAGSFSAADGWNAGGRARAVPLALAGPFLPSATTVSGTVDADFDFAGSGDDVRGELRARPGPGRFEYRAADGETFGLAFADTRLTARLDPSGLEAELQSTIAEQGTVSATVELGPMPASGAATDRRLSGAANIGFPNLRLLTGFVPAARDLEGSARLDARLGGTLGEPTVDGVLEIADGSARLVPLGIELTGIGVRIVNEGRERLSIEGGVRSGPGHLDIRGTLGLSAEDGWPLTLAIDGSRFQIVQLPEAEGRVSPDIDVRFAGGRVRLSGLIEVPYARITLKELPKGARRVSADEVIIGEEAPRAASAQQPSNGSGPIEEARIVVRLGDNVTFDGFGLTTRLTGEVDVTSGGGLKPLVRGRVEASEGRYKAYGQSLTIEQGAFLFTGPVENPAIQVRATRTARSDDVVAGIELSGSARRPEARIFSRPPLPEAEALSYLLTGSGLEGAGTKVDKALVADAVAGLGLSRAGGVTSRIADAFGLDEARIRNEGDVEATSLVLGKYLMPDLYVGYALGLFEREGYFEMKYRLLNNLQLKTQSGTRQSMDLIYSIERE